MALRSARESNLLVGLFQKACCGAPCKGLISGSGKWRCVMFQKQMVMERRFNKRTAADNLEAWCYFAGVTSSMLYFASFFLASRIYIHLPSVRISI